MRICFLFCLQFFYSLTGLSQIEIIRQDSGKCYALCGAPVIYKFESIAVVNSPKHKKVLIMPESYIVSIDTIQYASGDSVWQTLPGIYDVTEEKVMLSNGKSKIISSYTVIQEPKHEFTRDQKKYKKVTVYEAADLPSKKKVEFPATYTHVSLKKLVAPISKEIETEVL